MVCTLLCLCEYMGTELFPTVTILLHSNKCYHTYTFPVANMEDTVHTFDQKPQQLFQIITSILHFQELIIW